MDITGSFLFRQFLVQLISFDVEAREVSLALGRPDPVQSVSNQIARLRFRHRRIQRLPVGCGSVGPA